MYPACLFGSRAVALMGQSRRVLDALHLENVDVVGQSVEERAATRSPPIRFPSIVIGFSHLFEASR